MSSVLTKALDAVASGRDLSAQEASDVLAVIMAGEAEEAQIAGLLIGLRTKGETREEIAGLAFTMRELAAPVTTTRRDLVDTAGTGGGRPSFNVSTTAALIAAGAGCAMAKHGNRTATGLSGSADVLEALGVRIDLNPKQVGRCLDEVGFGFMFAPAHHGATRHVIPVRRSLAVRTIFNFLGPLTNPAGARRQLIGVSDAGVPRDDGRGTGAARRGPCVGRILDGRPGRAEHRRSHPGGRGQRHQDRLLHGQPRGRGSPHHHRPASDGGR